MQKIPHFIGKPAPKGYVAGISRGAKGFSTEAAVGRIIELEEQPDEEALTVFENLDRKRKRKVPSNISIEQSVSKSIDVKSSLVGMSMDDWLAIPEATNISKKKRVKIQEKIVHAPEKINYKESDLYKLSTSDKLMNTTEPLLDLGDVIGTNSTDIGDVRKARNLLSSIVQSNQTNGPSWIALARIEELSNNVEKARQIIMRATEHCNDNEDVWLEAVRLHSSLKVKSVLSQAIKYLPKSEELWIKAIESESIVQEKLKLNERAVELCPTSLKLWKLFIESHDSKEAVVELLKKAVIHIPDAIDFYIALYKLQPYSEAKETLTIGIKKTGSELLHLHICYLEEVNNIDNHMKAINIFVATCKLTVERCLMLAVQSIQKSFSKTAFSLINTCIDAITDDSIDYLSKISPELTKYVLIKQNNVISPLSSIQKQFQLSSSIQDKISLLMSTNLVETEDLWLQLCIEDTQESIDILKSAVVHLNTLNLYRRLCDIYIVLNKPKEALDIASKGVATFKDPKMYLKLAKVQLYLNNHVEYIDECINLFPKYPKFYLMKVEVFYNDPQVALSILKKATIHCPIEEVFYEQSKIYERTNKLSRARASLERGRKIIPTSDFLWIASSRFEMRQNKQQVAISILRKGLQLFPTSGKLWNELLFTEYPQNRKMLVVEALDKCKDDYLVALGCARYYWSIDDVDQASKWFLNSFEICKLYGDFYIYFYAFNQQTTGNIDVIEMAIQNKPKYGDLWTAYSKNHNLLSIKDILTKAVKWVKKDENILNKQIIDVHTTKAE